MLLLARASARAVVVSALVLLACNGASPQQAGGGAGSGAAAGEDGTSGASSAGRAGTSGTAGAHTTGGNSASGAAAGGANAGGAGTSGEGGAAGAGAGGEGGAEVELWDGAQKVACGGFHCCAVSHRGLLKCWGYNDGGELGLHDLRNRGNDLKEMGNALPAVELGSGRRAVDVVAAGTKTCVLLDDATVKCWGSDVGGIPVTGDALAPVDLGTGAKVTAVSVSDGHACAVLADHSLKCWGGNGLGELGLGDTRARYLPADLGDNLPAVDFDGHGVLAVSAASVSTCAILDDHSVRCWGSGFRGALGLGGTDNVGDEPGEMGANLPRVELGTGRTAVSISANTSGACAVLDDGSLKCWGANVDGSLGLEDAEDRGDGPDEMGDGLAAVDLGAGRKVVQVSSADWHTCALLDDASVKCWGQNKNGELGQGDTKNRGGGSGQMGKNLPAVLLGNGTVEEVTADVFSNCVLFADGSITCWGNVGYGGLGNGNPLNNVGDEPGEMGAALVKVDLGG